MSADAISLGGRRAAGRNPNLFVAVVGATAVVALLAALPSLVERIGHRPAELGAFAALAVLLQLVPLEIYGRGTVSFAGVAPLAAGSCSEPRRRSGSPPWPASRSSPRGARRRPGASSTAHRRCSQRRPARRRMGSSRGPRPWWRRRGLRARLAGLLGAAYAVAHRKAPAEVWRERLGWVAPLRPPPGPSRGCSPRRTGRPESRRLAAVALGPVGVMLVMRHYVTQTQEGDADVRRGAEELHVANEELAERNRDLQALLQLTAASPRGHATGASSSPTPKRR